ncbi:DNA primase [Bacillus sp. FJAT-45350]|uniref:DNA primase n=1 Tax=Bacillus sp. FJAT-45350 TaxID=2011014 RepID=UPI000BB6E9F5|nr:DNA primase [Bacillus sp. FJAT-45350]
MKKFLLSIASGALALSVLAACGETPAEEEAPVDEDTNIEEPAGEEAPIDEEPAEEEELELEIEEAEEPAEDIEEDEEDEA